MKRRDFLSGMSVGIGAASFAGAAFATQTPPHLTDHALRDVTRNIHAQFGSGFEVCSARQVGSQTKCVIEHYGNQLVVTSHDGAQWTILHATEM